MHFRSTQGGIIAVFRGSERDELRATSCVRIFLGCTEDSTTVQDDWYLLKHPVAGFPCKNVVVPLGIEGSCPQIPITVVCRHPSPPSRYLNFWLPECSFCHAYEFSGGTNLSWMLWCDSHPSHRAMLSSGIQVWVQWCTLSYGTDQHLRILVALPG